MPYDLSTLSYLHPSRTMEPSTFLHTSRTMELCPSTPVPRPRPPGPGPEARRPLCGDILLLTYSIRHDFHQFHPSWYMTPEILSPIPS